MYRMSLKVVKREDCGCDSSVGAGDVSIVSGRLLRRERNVRREKAEMPITATPLM